MNNIFKSGLWSLILAFVLTGSVGAQPANQWPVDATLAYSYCQSPDCGTHPVTRGTITWGTKTSMKRTLNSPQVVFGPFKLTRGTSHDRKRSGPAGYLSRRSLGTLARGLRSGRQIRRRQPAIAHAG